MVIYGVALLAGCALVPLITRIGSAEADLQSLLRRFIHRVGREIN